MSLHDENKKKPIDITGKRETVQCIEMEQRDRKKYNIPGSDAIMKERLLWKLQILIQAPFLLKTHIVR